MTPARHAIALLAICAVLAVTTVSVLPGHAHDAARPCDICHSGHLPCLQPSGEIQLYKEMPVVCQKTAEDFKRYLESASVIRSPRAPPV